MSTTITTTSTTTSEQNIATAIGAITNDVKNMIVQKANGAAITMDIITQILPEVMVIVENIFDLSGDAKQTVVVDSIVSALNQLDFPDKDAIVETIQTLAPSIITMIVKISKSGIAINVIKKSKSIFACFGKGSSSTTSVTGK